MRVVFEIQIPNSVKTLVQRITNPIPIHEPFLQCCGMYNYSDSCQDPCIIYENEMLEQCCIEYSDSYKINYTDIPSCSSPCSQYDIFNSTEYELFVECCEIPQFSGTPYV